MATTASSNLSRLKSGALVMAVLAVVQLILGALATYNVGGELVHEIHGGVGYLILLDSAITAFFAFRYGRAHDQMGRFGHAVSIPVLCVIQIGLAEASGGQGPLRIAHIVVGILTVLAIISLYTIMRKVED